MITRLHIFEYKFNKLEEVYTVLWKFDF